MPGAARDANARAAVEPPRWTMHQGAWLLVARTLPQLNLLVVAVVAARVLGTDGMGRQALIAFVCLCVVTAVTGGLPTAVMRHVSARIGAHDAGQALALVAWHRKVACAAAAAGALALVAAALWGAMPPLAWLFGAIVVAARVLHTAPSALLHAQRRWRDASVAGVTTGTLGAVAIVLVLVAGGGIAGMFAVEAAAATASFAWTARLARRAAGTLQGMPDARADVRDVLRFALPATLNVALTLVVWQRSEVLFLGHFSGDAAVAVFSVATAAINALRMPFDVAASIVLPTVAAFAGAGALAPMHDGFRRVARLALQGGIVAASAAYVLAPPLLTMLFGAPFAPAERVLAILCVAFPVVPLGLACAALLSGLGRQGAVLATTAVGAAVSIALDVLLIPSFGAVGAAHANVLAQVVTALVLIVLAARATGGLRLREGRLPLVALASVAGGALAWLAQRAVAGVAGVVVGAVAFATLLALAELAWGILDAQDRGWLAARLRALS
jgi:O-antigen/teichoic acid export membrane protein